MCLFLVALCSCHMGAHSLAGPWDTLHSPKICKLSLLNEYPTYLSIWAKPLLSWVWWMANATRHLHTSNQHFHFHSKQSTSQCRLLRCQQCHPTDSSEICCVGTLASVSIPVPRIAPYISKPPTSAAGKCHTLC